MWVDTQTHIHTDTKIAILCTPPGGKVKMQKRQMWSYHIMSVRPYVIWLGIRYVNDTANISYLLANSPSTANQKDKTKQFHTVWHDVSCKHQWLPHNTEHITTQSIPHGGIGTLTFTYSKKAQYLGNSTSHRCCFYRSLVQRPYTKQNNAISNGLIRSFAYCTSFNW